MQTRHTIATSKPPPRAMPSIAATDGFRASDSSKNLMMRSLKTVNWLTNLVEGKRTTSYLLLCQSENQQSGTRACLFLAGAYKNLAVEVRNARTYNDRLVLTWLILERIYVKSR